MFNIDEGRTIDAVIKRGKGATSWLQESVNETYEHPKPASRQRALSSFVILYDTRYIVYNKLR